MKVTTVKPLATIEVLNRIKELNEKLNQLCAEKSYQELSSDEQLTWDSIYNERLAISDDYNWFDVPYKEGGRYGVKDVFGNVVVPAKFDDYVELFHYDFRRSAIPMVLNGKTVLVKSDGSGEVVPNTEYDSIHYSAYTPYYRMWKDGKFGLMSCDGTVYVDCICDELFEPINDICLYRSGDKWGVLDIYGNVVAPKFDEIVETDFDECVKVRVGDLVGYINKAGEFTQNEEEAYWTFNNKFHLMSQTTLNPNPLLLH